MSDKTPPHPISESTDACHEAGCPDSTWPGGPFCLRHENELRSELGIQAIDPLSVAAPDLLAALRTAYDQLAALAHIYQFTEGDEEVNREVLAKAKVAITKAAGAEPDQIGPGTPEFIAAMDADAMKGRW